jgi:hypothetical protein
MIRFLNLLLIAFTMVDPASCQPSGDPLHQSGSGMRMVLRNGNGGNAVQDVRLDPQLAAGAAQLAEMRRLTSQIADSLVRVSALVDSSRLHRDQAHQALRSSNTRLWIAGGIAFSLVLFPLLAYLFLIQSRLRDLEFRHKVWQNEMARHTLEHQALIRGNPCNVAGKTC